MRTTRAGLVVTACVAIVGCTGSEALEPREFGPDGGFGGGAGTMGALGGSSGAASGTGGFPTSAGIGATTASSGSGSSGGGGASAGASGGGMAGRSGAGGGSAASSASGASGSAGVAGHAGAAGAAPTFTELWNRTLENGCAVPYCHDGSGKGWSGFDQATAYRTLVRAASTTCPGETRVVPGEPARSVLAAAISHTDLGTCDVPTMPRDRAKLPQADIDRIIAWILAGAQND